MSLGTLYIMAASPRSNWMGAYIKELNLDINVKDMFASEEFATIVPLHKAPAFFGTDGFQLTETPAIALYFAQLAGSDLIGKTVKEKSLVVQWLSFINSDLNNSLFKVMFFSKTDEEKKIELEKIAGYLKYIDDHLSSSKLLVGDSYTVADIYGAHIVNQVSKLHDIKQFSNIKRWLDAVESTSATLKYIKEA